MVLHRSQGTLVSCKTSRLHPLSHGQGVIQIGRDVKTRAWHTRLGRRVQRKEALLLHVALLNDHASLKGKMKETKPRAYSLQRAFLYSVALLNTRGAGAVCVNELLHHDM